jgi:hypothetical protein
MVKDLIFFMDIIRFLYKWEVWNWNLLEKKETLLLVELQLIGIN